MLEILYSFLWGPAYFQARTASFREGIHHERQALQRENRSVDDLFEALAGASCIACFAGEYELYPDCPPCIVDVNIIYIYIIIHMYV